MVDLRIYGIHVNQVEGESCRVVSEGLTNSDGRSRGTKMIKRRRCRIDADLGSWGQIRSGLACRRCGRCELW